jgi:hypothetical protein
MIDITQSLPIEIHGERVKFLSDKTLVFPYIEVGKPKILYVYNLETNKVVQKKEYPPEVFWRSCQVFNGEIYMHTAYYTYFIGRQLHDGLIRIDPETLEASPPIKTDRFLSVLRELSEGFLATFYVESDKKGNYIHYFETWNKTIRVKKKYLKGLPEAIEYPYVLLENKTFILRGSTPEKYWILQRRAESYDVMEYYPSTEKYVKRFEFPLRPWHAAFSMADRIIVTPTKLLFFDKEELYIYPLDGTGEEQRMPFFTNNRLQITDYDSRNDRALILSSISSTNVSCLLINRLSE